MAKNLEVFTAAVALLFVAGDIQLNDIPGQVVRQCISNRFLSLVSFYRLSFRFFRRFFERFRFVEQLFLTFKTLTGSCKLLVLMQAELFFIPHKFRLQLNILKLKGFYRRFVWRSHRIHVVYYQTEPPSFSLQQVMDIQAAGW